jgi:hypothetical protein
MGTHSCPSFRDSSADEEEFGTVMNKICADSWTILQYSTINMRRTFELWIGHVVVVGTSSAFRIRPMSNAAYRDHVSTSGTNFQRGAIDFT